MTINKKTTNLLVILSRFLLFCLALGSDLTIAENHTSNKNEAIEKVEHIKIPEVSQAELDYLTEDFIGEEEFHNRLEDVYGKYDHESHLLSETEKSEWIFESALNNAPELLKGIISYFDNEWSDGFITPSFHRFILVGPPGSGKTTLAHAIADMLHCKTIFVPATSLLGHYRNETSINITRFLEQYTVKRRKMIIIIDELHKLFEHHTDDHSDDSQTAASFWLMLDKIEKYNPNAIIIGTANNVDKLPPEIKSRFFGKIITLPLPSKKQRIRAFKNTFLHDPDIKLHKSINHAFIFHVLEQINDCSLRDVKLIIDTAKMFYYADYYIDWDEINECESPIILEKRHFEKALKQLQAESKVLEKSFIEKYQKKLEPWGLFFSIGGNAASLIRLFI